MRVKSTNIFICMSLNPFTKLTGLNLLVLISISYKDVYSELSPVVNLHKPVVCAAYRKGLKLY